MFTPTRASGIVYGPGNKPPIVGYPAILNDRGAVTYYQQTLRSLGFDLGASGADGLWGDRTRESVRAYQQRKRIGVDGLLGPETQRALQSEPEPVQPAATPAVQRPPPASEWDTAPVTRIHLPDQPWWQDVPSTRGFLDNVTVAPSVGSSGTSPWVAVAAGAALLTGVIAFARYYDEKKTR